MKKPLLFLVLAIAPFVGSACSTTGKVASIPGIGFSTESLKRAEYEILGAATAEACAEESCSFGNCNKKASVPGEELLEGRMFSTNIGGVETRTTDAGPLGFLFGAETAEVSGSDIAERIAMYKAIESVPTADAIILPRKTITVETSNTLGLFTTTKSCVKVSGKAVRLKADNELSKP
jgi:hypothetical protein